MNYKHLSKILLLLFIGLTIISCSTDSIENVNPQQKDENLLTLSHRDSTQSTNSAEGQPIVPKPR